MTDASGYQYKGNRYFDPKSGRFTQEDPIGIAGGLNVYGFAEGDPVSYSDPFGLCGPATPICVAAAALAGRILASPAGQRALERTALVASRVGPAIQRGMQNPRVAAAVERGNRVHAVLREGFRQADHQAEVFLQNSRGRIDAMMVDAQNKVLTLVEFKPEGSLARGLRQVGQYADDVRDLIRKGAEGWKQYQGYEIQTKVIEYPK